MWSRLYFKSLFSVLNSYRFLRKLMLRNPTRLLDMVFISNIPAQAMDTRESGFTDWCALHEPTLKRVILFKFVRNLMLKVEVMECSLLGHNRIHVANYTQLHFTPSEWQFHSKRLDWQMISFAKSWWILHCMFVLNDAIADGRVVIIIAE